MVVLLILLLAQAVLLAKADYHIGYIISNYSNPNNTLYNGDCCKGTSACLNGGCNTALRLCVRETNHPQTDTDSTCKDIVRRLSPGLHVEVGKVRPPIKEYYYGSFQVYIRVFHSVTANFDPPFSDPLIDNIFIESNLTATLFGNDNLQSTSYTMTGEHGRATMTLQVNVQCAQNYFGSACQFLCNTNGTDCIPVLTSSDVTLPGRPLPITDWVIVGVVSLMIICVVICIIGDHIFRRKKKDRNIK